VSKELYYKAICPKCHWSLTVGHLRDLETPIKEHFEICDADNMIIYIEAGSSGGSILQEGDVVVVKMDGEEFEAVIESFNDDDSITVKSELTGRRYRVSKDSIKGAQDE